MESLVQNKTVILSDNSKRSLDMDEIVDGVRNLYAGLATRSRDEAEHWHQKKVKLCFYITVSTY